MTTIFGREDSRTGDSLFSVLDRTRAALPSPSRHRHNHYFSAFLPLRIHRRVPGLSSYFIFRSVQRMLAHEGARDRRRRRGGQPRRTGVAAARRHESDVLQRKLSHRDARVCLRDHTHAFSLLVAGPHCLPHLLYLPSAAGVRALRRLPLRFVHYQRRW